MTGALATSLADTVAWLWRDDGLRDPAVATRARLLLLDCLGCALAALAKPELVEIAAALRVDEPGPLTLPVVGGGFTTANAASLLAMAICWDEACEGLPRAHGRPGIHAAAPAVALALARATPLGAVLRALVAGYEIGGRMGAAFRIKPGMHVDGTWGTFGAVAAVAQLRGLAPPAVLDALNGAACQLPYSLYLPIVDGHTARNVYLGHAAALALLVTATASGGVTAPASAPATQRRLALGLEPDIALAPPGTWLILEGYLKQFAAVRHVHYGAACALAWRAAMGSLVGSPAPAIRAVKLAVYQEALTYCANRAPRTAIQAQFSLSFGLARALRHGALEPDAYTNAALADPALQQLEQQIEIVVDPALTARGATLTVVSDKGTWRGGSADSPDDPERPMTAAAVEAKFLRYATPALGAGAPALAELILRGPLDARFIL